MKTAIPEDILCWQVFSKLLPSDLLLVKKAFPEHDQAIDSLIVSYKMKSKLQENIELLLPNQTVQPRLSPATGSLLVLFDSQECAVQLCDTANYRVLAEVNVKGMGQITSMNFSPTENMLLLGSEPAGFHVYTISKAIEGSSVSLRIDKLSSYFFKPPLENAYFVDPMRPHITHMISAFSPDSSTWTLAQVQIVEKKNPKLRIDAVTTKTSHINLLNPRYDFDLAISKVSMFTPNDSAIFCVGNTKSKIIPTFGTILLESQYSTAPVQLVRVIADPLRFFVPAGVVCEGAMLVNMIDEDGGPWVRKIPKEFTKGLLHSTRVSHCGRWITITRTSKHRVVLERMCSKDGRVKRTTKISLRNGQDLLGIRNSSDGRFTAVVYGQDLYHSCRIDGWALVDNLGDRHTKSKARTSEFDTFMGRTESHLIFNKTFDISSDGQLLTIIRQRKQTESRHTALVFLAATGEVVTELYTSPREHLNPDEFWDWSNSPGIGACRMSFVTGNSASMIMMRDVVRNVSLSVMRLGCN